MLFRGMATLNNFGLWVTDGTAGGTHEITGISGACTNGVGPSGLALFPVPTVYDFNADGNSDILFRNDNGTMAIWEMNGGNRSSAAPASAIRDRPGTSPPTRSAFDQRVPFS